MSGCLAALTGAIPSMSGCLAALAGTAAVPAGTITFASSLSRRLVYLCDLLLCQRFGYHNLAIQHADGQAFHLSHRVGFGTAGRPGRLVVFIQRNVYS